MEIRKLKRVDSTNNWVSENEGELPETVLVYCETQTTGRGQRGNSWESVPGKNITASVLFHPEKFPANQQFSISEGVALTIVEFLSRYGIEAKIKWPNDIYVGDKKICGILVEHVVLGKYISRCIIGIGINVNQDVFLSEAPNPISIYNLTGISHDVDEGAGMLASLMDEVIKEIENGTTFHSQFNDKLWRNDGNLYLYYDRNKKEQIEARIVGVETDGMLKLKTSTGEIRKFAFKEVEFIL